MGIVDKILLESGIAKGFTFKTVKNEEGAKIIASFEGDPAGYVTAEVWDADSLFRYKFEEVENIMSEKVGNDLCCVINDLEVDEYYRGSGVGTALLTKGIAFGYSNGAKHCFLNASPMGRDQVSVDYLEGFYNRVGFRTILDQGDNKIMYKKI